AIMGLVPANKKPVPNVLATRYASAELVELWSPENKIVLERRLWLAVLRAQSALGIEVPSEALADYEGVLEQVDLDSIADRERIARPRRQGPHRRVQRPGRPRARAQGHDQPRFDRERRAAADPRVAAPGARPGRGGAGPADRAGRAVSGAGHGRAQPQRR